MHDGEAKTHCCGGTQKIKGHELECMLSGMMCCCCTKQLARCWHHLTPHNAKTAPKAGMAMPLHGDAPEAVAAVSCRPSTKLEEAIAQHRKKQHLTACAC